MSIYRSHSVQAITFYRPDTFEVCQFDLLEGQTFTVTRSPIKQTVQSGAQITVMETVKLQVSVFDSGLYPMLKSWEQAKVKINVCAAGEPNLQWYNDSYLTIKRTSQSGDGLLKMDIEVDAVEVLGDKKIHMNENLFAFLAPGWNNPIGSSPNIDWVGNFGLRLSDTMLQNGQRMYRLEDNTVDPGYEPHDDTGGGFGYICFPFPVKLNRHYAGLDFLGDGGYVGYIGIGTAIAYPFLYPDYTPPTHFDPTEIFGELLEIPAGSFDWLNVVDLEWTSDNSFYATYWAGMWINFGTGNDGYVLLKGDQYLALPKLFTKPGKMVAGVENNW